MLMHSVYLLKDPRDNTIYYVGVSKDPIHRLTNHLSDPFCNPKKRAWFHSLKEVGLQPIIEIVEQKEDRKEAEDREQYWIHFYRDAGMPLFNANVYSRGGRPRNGTSPTNKNTSHTLVNKPHPQQAPLLLKETCSTQLLQQLSAQNCLLAAKNKRILELEEQNRHLKRDLKDAYYKLYEQLS